MPDDADYAKLLARLDDLENLSQHQAGVVIALYNGLNRLSSVMIGVNKSILSAVLGRDEPPDLQSKLEQDGQTLADTLHDIANRLDLMNDSLR
ncbi:hypothetical protein [Rubellimicrobium aerolatum]